MIMRAIKIIITVYLLFCVSMASAQNDSSFCNKNMLEIAHKGEHIGWVNIKEEYRFTKEDFFWKNKNALDAYITNENKLIKQKGGKSETNTNNKHFDINLCDRLFCLWKICKRYTT